MLLDAVTTYIHNLPDARQLSFAVLGLPLNSGRAAQTIVYSHGWPSSRLEALPLHDVAVNLGYRILSVDRPGVGKSTYNAAGSFESWASDIEHLLDEQQVDKAVFLGMSGGGPFACACARYLPHRTAALVTVSSMTETNSPAAAPLQQQMHWMNRMHCKIIGSPWALHASLLATWPLLLVAPIIVSPLQGFPDFIKKLIVQVLTMVGYCEADKRWLVDNPDLALQLLYVVQQSVLQGVAGVARDMSVTSNSWSFKLSDINAPVVLVFQGEDDINVPRVMGEYLAAHLAGAKAVVLPGEGHLTTLTKHAADILLQLDAALRVGCTLER